MNDQPSAREVAEAAAEVANVAGVLSRPTNYQSERKGTESIDRMNATHAERAARLVRRGERAGGPATARALERQSRRPGADSLRG